MKSRHSNRRSRTKGSALADWSKILGVSIILLTVVPRCVGCKSPIDRFWEARQKEGLEEYMRENPEMQRAQQKFDEEMLEQIKKSN